MTSAFSISASVNPGGVGEKLFDDPLLSIDNVKKLVDYMQWSFKYTKVSILLLFVFLELLLTSDQYCLVCHRMLPIDLS